MRLRACCRSSSLAWLMVWPAAAMACPAGGAVYRLELPGDPAPVELRLEPAALPGPMDLWLAIGPPDGPTVLRLMPVTPMGHGAMAAYPAPDPLPEDWLPSQDDMGLRLIALEVGRDDRLVPYDNLFPEAGDQAPAALALPGLASELWYGTNAGPAPVSLADGLWYLAACGP